MRREGRFKKVGQAVRVEAISSHPEVGRYGSSSRSSDSQLTPHLHQMNGCPRCCLCDRAAAELEVSWQPYVSPPGGTFGFIISQYSESSSCVQGAVLQGTVCVSPSREPNPETGALCGCHASSATQMEDGGGAPSLSGVTRRRELGLASPRVRCRRCGCLQIRAGCKGCRMGAPGAPEASPDLAPSRRHRHASRRCPPPWAHHVLLVQPCSLDSWPCRTRMCRPPSARCTSPSLRRGG